MGVLYVAAETTGQGRECKERGEGALVTALRTPVHNDSRGNYMGDKVDVSRGPERKPGHVIPWKPREELVPRRKEELLVWKATETYLEWKGDRDYKQKPRFQKTSYVKEWQMLKENIGL